MQHTKKKILLKLSGKVLQDPTTQELSTTRIVSLLEEIILLHESHTFAIVIGGGNFFRGAQNGTKLHLDPAAGHEIGMIATIINGLLIEGVCNKIGILNKHFSAIPCSSIDQISSRKIEEEQEKSSVIIFSGGTGNPFFSTDTAAVIRALQIHADELWKGTSVDGIYSQDPLIHKNATKFRTISYQKALTDNLEIMDSTAYTLAEKHLLPIRVFNIFTPNALQKATTDITFGTIIKKED